MIAFLIILPEVAFAVILGRLSPDRIIKKDNFTAGIPTTNSPYPENES